MSSEQVTGPRGTVGVRLPSIQTSFVGRDHDVTSGLSALKRRDVRALTLTGPGGVGKTRLAIEIARVAAETFSDGVIFIPLAAIRDPALVIPTIAKRLEMPDQTSGSLLNGLSLYLESHKLLLVLDNFEQVIDAAPDVDRLLQHSPQLKVIITSRVPLRIAGERDFPVSPLPVPPAGTSREASDSELVAVDLFIERARAAQPSRIFTDDERAVIAEICRQVDGLPLAIELAAARSRALPIAAIADRLEDRLSLLVSEGRDGPIRQLTMRDTIAWSYGLLDDDEQALFRRLSIFIGGFTQDAAEAVCQDLGCVNAECITALIDQSLVRRVVRPGVPERLRLLETVREFAADLLTEHGEFEAAQRWHAGYFADLTSEAEPHLIGSQQVVWLDTLEREHDNLRAALSWSLRQGDVEIALRLAACLWRFWERRGHISEGRPLLERVFAMAEGYEPDTTYVAARFGLGRLRYVQGDFAGAREVFEQLVEQSKRLKDHARHAGSLTQLSHLATREGDYLTARRLAEEGLAIRRRAGEHWGAAVSLLVLGRNAHHLGDHKRASTLTEEGISIFQRFGDRQGMADGYEHLGTYELRRGRFALARGHTEQALMLRQEIGDDMAVADALALLGYIAIGQRNYAGARALFARSLTRLTDLGARWRVNPALEGLAEIALATDDPERAVRIMGAADRMRAEMRSFLDPDALERHQRNVETARATLGDTRFEMEWQSGRTMSFDRICREAYAAGAPAARGL